MTYSVVITNYNGAEILKKNLPKVMEATTDALEILVIDDCSTDNSIEVLKSLKVKYIKTDKNSGFSTTTNLGVSKARGDLVVLLNSDVIPQKNFLEPILPLFNNEKLFAVGLHDIDDAGISRGRGVGKFIRGYLMHRPGEIKTDKSMWASGGSGVFRKKIWQELGGLDTIYNPAYGEDWDLGYRAWKSGYKIVFESKAIVNHYHEEGALKQRYSSFYRRAITFRNQNIFVLKNITDKKYLLEYFFFLPYHLIYKFDLSFWYGFLLFLIRIPRIKKASFVKSDKEIINLFSSEFKAENEELF
ncbi:MAG: glycosyltransferase [Patescibacteria group bacterium]